MESIPWGILFIKSFYFINFEPVPKILAGNWILQLSTVTVVERGKLSAIVATISCKKTGTCQS